MLYNTAGNGEDEKKFDAVFTNRIQYTKSVHSDVKDWIDNNIERWQETKPTWFQIELVPDEFLPNAVLEAAGGAQRERRSSRVSFVRNSFRVLPES